jgi:hypothetical protein
VRYRRLPPAAVVGVILTVLVYGQGLLQAAAAGQHEAGGPAGWSVSAAARASEEVRDLSTIFTQPGERP